MIDSAASRLVLRSECENPLEVPSVLLNFTRLVNFNLGFFFSSQSIKLSIRQLSVNEILLQFWFGPNKQRRNITVLRDGHNNKTVSEIDTSPMNQYNVRIFVFRNYINIVKERALLVLKVRFS